MTRVNSASPLSHASSNRPVDFTGAPGAKKKVCGHQVQEFKLSPEIRTLEKQLAKNVEILDSMRVSTFRMTPKDLTALAAKPEKLKELVWNLVSNAYEGDDWTMEGENVEFNKLPRNDVVKALRAALESEEPESAVREEAAETWREGMPSRKALEAAMARYAKALVSNPSTVPYEFAWHDTGCGGSIGVVGVNTKNGEISILQNDIIP